MKIGYKYDEKTDIYLYKVDDDEKKRNDDNNDAEFNYNYSVIKFNDILNKNIEEYSDKEYTLIMAVSLTWPPLNINAEQFNNLYLNYSAKINFLSIYTAEAHADDEWPIRTKKDLRIPQHKTIKERVSVSMKFKEMTKWLIPLYIDHIKNKFQSHFDTWPLRVWIMDKTKTIKWILQPGIDDYATVDFNEIPKILDELIGNNDK